MYTVLAIFLPFQLWKTSNFKSLLQSSKFSQTGAGSPPFVWTFPESREYHNFVAIFGQPPIHGGFPSRTSIIHVMNPKLQLQFLLEQVIPRDIWFQLFMKAVALWRAGHKEKLTVEILCVFICIPAFCELIRSMLWDSGQRCMRNLNYNILVLKVCQLEQKTKKANGDISKIVFWFKKD